MGEHREPALDKMCRPSAILSPEGFLSAGPVYSPAARLPVVPAIDRQESSC
jgi:hypothetical protein